MVYQKEVSKVLEECKSSVNGLTKEQVKEHREIYGENALAEKKNDIYKGLLEGMTPEDVSDEVRRSLHELARRGFKLAVGSSSKNTKRILEKVALTEMFDAISDGTNIQRSKPDPEVFIKAAQFLGLEPQQCLVVEDADAGIEAAIAAGMYSAAVSPAAETGKADYLLKDFADLLNITALDRTEGDHGNEQT